MTTVRVTIQQPSLPLYRIPVFRELAARPGIDLHVIYGETVGLQNAAPHGFSAELCPLAHFGRRSAGLMWHSPPIPGHRPCDVLVLSWNLRYLSLLPALLAAKACQVRTVLWGHGYSKNDAHWRSSLRRRVATLADATLFYSHRAARALVLQGLPAGKAFVALNSLDQTPIQRAREQWLSRPHDLAAFRQQHDLTRGPVFLFVSRLEADNRVNLLLQALKLLLPQFPHAKAIVIGNGPDSNSLRALAASLGIADRVIFTGAIYDEQQLAPYFLSSKAFCYPANIGLSILHAFGYGLPVITSDRTESQNPEIEALGDGRNGLLYQDGNVNSLVSRLAQVAGDHSLCQRLADHAHATATAHFSLANMVDGMEAAIRYAAAVGSGSLRPCAPGGRPSPRPRRLAIIANANTPYRQHQHLRITREMPEVELWSLFTHNTSNAPWTLQAPGDIRPVLFGAGESTERQGRLSAALHEYMKGGRIIRWLREHAIDAVLILGYNDAGRMRIIHWCHAQGVPILLWGDSNIRGDRSRGLRRLLKNSLLPPLLAKCSAVLSCGRLGMEYFAAYGVPREKMHLLTLEPDYSLIEDLDPAVVDQVAEQYSVSRSRRHIIFPGRLVPEKRVDLLIKAYAQIASQRPEWDLLIVGNGPLRSELGAMVPAQFKNRVIWPGFLGDQRYVSAMYKLADVLVLPSSYEPWALVINEATAAGLAIVTSDVVGAAPELVRDGVNGRVFPSGDGEALVQALLEVTQPEMVRRMREASPKVLQEWREAADPIDGLRTALRAIGVLPPSDSAEGACQCR